LEFNRFMSDRVRRLIVRIKDLLRTFLGQESYSQEGEDLVLARIFYGKSTGFYVDIGCFHPIRFSNTYIFYRRGWRGINVDATPGVKADFQKIRPRDINIEGFVSADSSPRRFYLLSEPALNTSNENLAVQRAKDNPAYQIDETITVRPRSLKAILDEYLPKGQSIDFLSVDVEGSDLDVLISNDWDRYKPGIVVAELLATTLEDVARHEIAQFLATKGYRPASKFYNTVLFRLAKPQSRLS
jgi:FkbM family methyltransferase